MPQVKKEDKITSKWGEMFEGEEMVEIFIPKDTLNPTNAEWLSINGQEIWLAKGKKSFVPKSVAELWQRSYQRAIEAQEQMNSFKEIQ